MCKCYEHAIVITNRALVNGDFLEQLQKVSQVHPHALILREKDLPDTEYEKLAAKVLEIYRTAGVPVFLHSRMEIAARLGVRIFICRFLCCRICQMSGVMH